MKHLWIGLVGFLATGFGFLSLVSWTLRVKAHPQQPIIIDTLLTHAPGLSTGFVVLIAVTAMLAETCVVLRSSRRATPTVQTGARVAVLVAAAATVVLGLLLHRRQLQVLSERLAPAMGLAGRCNAGRNCPAYGVGDGAAFARIAVTLAVLIALAAAFRWSIALLGAVLLAIAQNLGPQTVGHLVTATEVEPFWSWPFSSMISCLVLGALMIWWVVGLWAPRWWWFGVGVFGWAVFLALAQLLPGYRDEAAEALSQAPGLGVFGDNNADYPLLAFVLPLPLWLLITWRAERRRPRGPGDHLIPRRFSDGATQ